MKRKTRGIREFDALVDGQRVHYLRAGSGAPLILLHGLVGSLHNWRRNVDTLAQTATVYALDLINMGESDRIHGLDAGLEATADRVVAFMDVLGLETADLAGHSHGGAVSLSLAARYPERVDRLILFAPANPFCDLGQQLIRFYGSPAGRRFARLIPAMPRWTKSIALRRMYGDPGRVAPGTLEGYTAGLAAGGTIDHVLEILRGWNSDMERLLSVLPSLNDTPALLLWGDRDRAVGLASGRQLQRMLPRASLVVLPGVGHIAFEEMPGLCNRTMLDFLATAATRSVSRPKHALRIPTHAAVSSNRQARSSEGRAAVNLSSSPG